MNEILIELFASDTPVFVFSMLIPLLFLIFMLKNKESKYILSFFCWGLLSVILAFILNKTFTNNSAQYEFERITDDVAPIVEETLKALPLFLFLNRKDTNKNLLIYCAMASGIGFSIQETLYYFNYLTTSVGISTLLPILLRTVTTCLMHGMSTAILGYGLTVTYKYKTIRIPLMLGLIALSATIHSLYNVLIGTHLAVIALLMPAVLYFFGLVLLSENESVDDKVE